MGDPKLLGSMTFSTLAHLVELLWGRSYTWTKAKLR